MYYNIIVKMIIVMKILILILVLKIMTWCRIKTVTWTNDDLLSIDSLGINFNEIWNKSNLKMLSAKKQPFLSSLNILK